MCIRALIIATTLSCVLTSLSGQSLQHIPHSFGLQSSQSTAYSKPYKAIPQAKEQNSLMGIQVEANDDAEELVNSIFKNNSCFETNNHEYDGLSGYWPLLDDTVSQLGTFTNGLSSIGIDEGIVMINSDVKEITGPNDNFAEGLGFFRATTDEDAIMLAGNNPALDVVILEFDFTPTSNLIDFNYVFASEEYCFSVGFQTADVFGFLISGPGINGPFSDNAKNIAVLPDGAVSPTGQNNITSSTINHIDNTDLFRSNTDFSGFDGCLDTPPVAFNDIEFDGFTTVLTASSEVIPCETYHLKLILADIGDAWTSSAIFLQRGSFTAGLIDVSEPSANAQTNDLNNAPLEGCSNGQLVFSRLDGSDLSDSVTVYFNINSASTATFGEDYIMPTDSVVIPAGQASDTLEIEIFGDDLDEGTESIVIQVEGTCNCADFRSEFFIVDPPPIDINLPDPQPDCPDTSVDLIPDVSGGIGAYSFAWSSGELDSINNVTRLAGDSIYVLSVTDECQQVVVDSVVVSSPDIRATVAGRYVICDAPDIAVPVVVSGGTNYTIEVVENGSPNTYTGTGDTIWLTYSNDQQLAISTVTADGCTGVASGVAEVVRSQFNVSSQVSQVDCPSGENGRISIDVNGNNNAYTFQWTDVSLAGPSVSNLAAGSYGLRILDQDMCPFDTIFTITQPAAMSLQLPTFMEDCAGTELDLIPSVTGGGGGYTFNWSVGNPTDSVQRITRLPGTTTYYLSVTDGCGSQLIDSITLTSPDIRATLSGSASLCDDPTARIPVAVSGGSSYSIVVNENGTPATYTGNGDTLWLTYNQAVNLDLISVSSGGCNGTVAGSASVTDGSFDVTAVLTQIACKNGNTGAITLDVNGSPGAFTYDWTDQTLSGFELDELVADTYPVRIFDAAGCFTDTTFTLSEPAEALSIRLDSTRDQTCLADGYLEIFVSGGTGTLDVAWMDSASSALSRDNLPGGTEYIVVVSDGNNCELRDTFMPLDRRTTVEANISAPSNTLTCTQNEIMLTASGTNLDPVNYRWINLASGTEMGTDINQPVSQAGSYQLIVTNPDNGCAATAEIDISLSDEFLTLSFPETYTLNCTTNVVELVVEANNFSGDISYAWMDADMNPLGTTNRLPNVVNPGTYSVVATRTDNNCTTTIVTTVTEDRTPPTVMVAAQGLLSCAEEFAPVVVQNLDITNAAYLWSTTDGQIDGPVDLPEATATAPGTYTLRLTNQDNGCFSEAATEVLLDQRTLSVSAGVDQILPCGEIPLLLSGVTSPSLPGTGFSWRDSDNNTVSSTADFVPDRAGIYTLVVSHPESGCTSSDEVSVTSEGPDRVDYSVIQAPCEEIGGSLDINNVMGGTAPYSYAVGAQSGLETVLTGIPSGFQRLVVTDANGCTFEEEVQFFTPTNLEGVAEDITVRLGEEAQLNVETNRDNRIVEYAWRAPFVLSCEDCPNPTIAPLESFTADVFLVDEDGCTLSLRQNVFVDERQIVYVPNAFSPGQLDGFNDRLTVFGDPRFITNVLQFTVFDRWGNQLYAATNFLPGDENRGWDGTYRGQAVSSGAFVYFLEVQLWDGRKEEYRGVVNLVR